jgi:hypothetical protein
LCIKLLLRNDAFLEEEFVALTIHFGVFALGLVFGELAQSLFQLNLKGPRIDLREKIAFVDELAFLESNTTKLAVHAAANGNGIESGNCAETVEINGQIAVLRSGNHDRNRRPSRAWSAFPFTGGSGGRGRIGSRLTRGL